MDEQKYVEFVRKELFDTAELFHERVEKFREILMPEYIDTAREKQSLSNAKDALIHLEGARKAAENFMKRRKDIAPTIKELLTTFSEKTSLDMIKYQRAVLIFKRREEEYNNMSPLARHFLTPRTRFAKAWEEEEEMGRSAHPESNFFVIIFAVVISLASIAFLLSTEFPSNVSGFPTKVASATKVCFETVKSFVFNLSGKGIQKMENAKLDL